MGDFWSRREDKMDPIHKVVSAIGPEKTCGILFMLSVVVTLCQSFDGSKISALKTWDVCDEVSNTFVPLQLRRETGKPWRIILC